MKTMSSTSDKKPDFLFANCEHCEGIIRIPINVRPDSSVSCPHCNSRFELANVLNQQVPEIQFVDGPAPSPVEITTDEVKIDTESGTEQTDGKFVVPPQLAAGIKKRRRRRRKSSSEGSSSSRKAGPLSEAESNRLARRKDRAVEEREKLQQQREAAALRSRIKQDGSTTSSSRSRSRGASRRKTSKRSPVFEAFKIGAGGLLAIPIAYLLLMWIFSRDPLQLAPKLNAVLPILVPSKMKPDDSTDLPAATEDSNRSRSSSLPVPKTDPDDIDPDNIDFNR
jgi:hypothetical protein